MSKKKAVTLKTKGSSFLKSLKYDGKDLTVTFNGGSKLIYKDVPKHIFETMQFAMEKDNPSAVGSIFARLIKRNFKTKKAA